MMFIQFGSETLKHRHERTDRSTSFLLRSIRLPLGTIVFTFNAWHIFVLPLGFLHDDEEALHFADLRRVMEMRGEVSTTGVDLVKGCDVDVVWDVG